MIEIPESYTISRQIKESLVGLKIVKVIALKTPHKFAFLGCDKEEYEKNLIDEEIIDSTYLGGLIIIKTTNHQIFFSDGAIPKYYMGAFPDRHQLAIIFEDGTGIFVNIQMYGHLGLFSGDKCENLYYQSSLKTLNSLDKEFTYNYFKTLYKPNGKKMSVKEFCATNQRIPGLGNGVLQDILFNAKIDPRFDMRNMTEEMMKDLYYAIITTTKEMAKACGRDTEKDLFGSFGSYKCKLSKNTVGNPCPKCGNIIEKTNYMGGTIYFCSNCQKRQ